jgi:hypothetical protein
MPSPIHGIASLVDLPAAVRSFPISNRLDLRAKMPREYQKSVEDEC